MTDPLVNRVPVRLRPNPSRVVTQLFVAGQEVVGGAEGRAADVVARILELDETVVVRRLADLVERFGDRHRDLLGTFGRHADRVADRIDPSAELSEERWLVLGAAFTHEYAIEAAALCNPSIVAAPDQSAAPPGGVAVIVSLRGIGEGHRSSIAFRTGTVTQSGAVTIDAPGPFPVIGTPQSGVFDRDAFHGRLRAIGADGETAASVLNGLESTFTSDELDRRLALLASQSDTRLDADGVIAELRAIASCSYRVQFAADSEVSERVLAPAMAAESHGLEDARFVRFVDDDGSATYYASYTAFDGVAVTQQLLQTTDFSSFSMSPMVGPAAANKGLALFPRRINGRYVALTRHDRATNAVAVSDSLSRWQAASTLQVPEQDWEVIQLGNCGSPIETDVGWLVITHGVGPMRTYSLGALLLDLEDPTRVVAALAAPLLTPLAREQDGYVPNVVYSCGSFLFEDTLVLPYGIGDADTGFATISWPELRDAMTSPTGAPRGRPSREVATP